MAHQAQRHAQLTQLCAQHESRIANLVKEAEAHERALADGEAHNAALELQLGKVKHALLAGDHTQAILLDLYPDDALIKAHTQLVRNMREKGEGFEVRVRDLLSQLAQARDELLEKDTALRQAVQKCQETENRLEDALYFISQRGLGGPFEKATTMDDSSAPDNKTQGEKREEEEEEEENSPRWDTFNQTIRDLQICVESQKGEIDRLHKTEAAWKDREKTLREQLAAMSQNPLSENARRYGLKTVHSFEAMMEEMQARVVESQAQVDLHAANLKELEAGVREAEERWKTAEQRVVGLQNDLAELTSAREVLHREREELNAVVGAQKAQLEAHDEALSQLKKTLAELETHNRAAEQALKECVAARDKFCTDNRALVDKIDELVRALVQAEAEKRAAVAQSARAARTMDQDGLHYHPRIGGIHALPAHANDSARTDPN
ncbi:unnamed protein product [Phytomonas sp. Hart1]|nr:unnamed protein product [Phytomonas sp. Hart1]|eukprot:CCW67773.1 unnamed protein product [Phytomonas sp. isolate Hart1]